MSDQINLEELRKKTMNRYEEYLKRQGKELDKMGIEWEAYKQGKLDNYNLIYGGFSVLYRQNNQKTK